MSDNVRKCILMRSYAGGGKSTKAHELAKEIDAVVVSADDYWYVDGKYKFDVTRLKFAHQECFQKFKTALTNGKNVIVDNTNIKFEDIKKYLEYLIVSNNTTKYYYHADICEVEFNTIEQAILHRTGREDEKNIPKERMYEMYRAYKRTNAIALLYSNYQGKFPFIFERNMSSDCQFFDNYYIKDESKTPAIICDLDGTLALFKMPDGTSLRNPFDAEKCDTDIINVAVAKALFAFELMDHQTIFVSGREDKFREQTTIFLNRVAEKYGINKCFLLHMRQSGDFRPDDIVKDEIYNTHIKDNYQVTAVFDDRKRVVKMWKAKGLMVFDCNYLDEDF